MLVFFRDRVDVQEAVRIPRRFVVDLTKALPRDERRVLLRQRVELFHVPQPENDQRGRIDANVRRENAITLDGRDRADRSMPAACRARVAISTVS